MTLMCLLHEVIAAEVSLVFMGDNEALPRLLNPTSDLHNHLCRSEVN
ncbi:hypothetical protein BTN49_0274 [Candidatus Enterovibrio escicola]|uniref:Mobile element protein n=1 Tax=Candidatus Enterovibrio escicola TaxID=1927127 RepID=A0A2A5T7E4_9GAMM|nr:hypothetical protein BTN49_0274 [Candidatus Enterovibrio escacola]